MTVRRALLTLSLVLAAAPLAAQAVQVKLGSIVPAGSPWEQALKRLATEWGELSGGLVKLIPYSGGTVGDEPSIVRKLKLGQLQAAGITARGLSQIYRPVLTLSLPLLTRDDAELDYVLDRMQPELEAGIEASGQKVMFWIRLGWVYFFGRKPVITPDDLRRQKLWVWTESPDEATVWKGLSFQIVQLQTTDVLTGLQSGMMDAFATSPLFAASRQWFALAPHMSEMRWAPLFGALVVSVPTWNRIPARLQPQLLSVARRIGNEVRVDTARADLEAIEVMRKYGLKTYPVSEGGIQQWISLVDVGFSRLLGTSFDPATAEKVASLVKSYRAGSGG